MYDKYSLLFIFSLKDKRLLNIPINWYCHIPELWIILSEMPTGVIHIGNYTGKIIIVLAVLLSNSLLFTGFSQKNAKPFQGQVTDMSGKAVSFATVNILGTNQGTVTDHNGHFSFRKFPQNARVLEVRCLGYETKVIELGEKEHIKNAFTVQLEAATEELSEAVVRGKSRAQQQMEKPIKIEAIDATKFQAQSTTIPQIINQTAGVKVRQSAGVGSGSTININGLQGRAIRYFRDDIPLDYLGHAYELSLVPIGLLNP